MFSGPFDSAGTSLCFLRLLLCQHPHETEEMTLPAGEFVRRWCLHILPAGFRRSRRFGGWSPRHRERYVAECRELRGAEAAGSAAVQDSADPEDCVSSIHSCPTRGEELERLEVVFRTSWRDVFNSDFCPAWYRTREPGG